MLVGVGMGGSSFGGVAGIAMAGNRIAFMRGDLEMADGASRRVGGRQLVWTPCLRLHGILQNNQKGNLRTRLRCVCSQQRHPPASCMCRLSLYYTILQSTVLLSSLSPPPLPTSAPPAGYEGGRGGCDDQLCRRYYREACKNQHMRIRKVVPSIESRNAACS